MVDSVIDPVPDFNEYDAGDYGELTTAVIGESARASATNMVLLITLFILFLAIGIGITIWKLLKK